MVRINFEVEKGNELRQQATQSTNPHIRYFVQQTGLQHCMSLLVIIPVSFRNILMCSWLLLWHSFAGKYIAFIKSLAGDIKKYKNQLTCWLKHPAPAGYANKESM